MHKSDVESSSAGYSILRTNTENPRALQMKLARHLLQIAKMLLVIVCTIGSAYAVSGDCGGCTPDPGSSGYSGIVAARGLPSNARGYSGPLVPRSGTDTLLGSQSYNYTIPIVRMPGRAGMDLVLKSVLQQSNLDGRSWREDRNLQCRS